MGEKKCEEFRLLHQPAPRVWPQWKWSSWGCEQSRLSAFLEGGPQGNILAQRWLRGLLLGRVVTIWTICLGSCALQIACMNLLHRGFSGWVAIPLLLAVAGSYRTWQLFQSGDQQRFLHDRTAGNVGLVLLGTTFGGLLALCCPPTCGGCYGELG